MPAPVIQGSDAKAKAPAATPEATDEGLTFDEVMGGGTAGVSRDTPAPTEAEKPTAVDTAAPAPALASEQAQPAQEQTPAPATEPAPTAAPGEQPAPTTQEQVAAEAKTWTSVEDLGEKPTDGPGTTFAKAMGGGAIKGTTGTVGMVEGAKYGATALAVATGGNPVATAIGGVGGGIIGLVGGFWLGQQAADVLEGVGVPIIADPDRLPSGQREWAVMGDVFGAGVTSSIGLVGIAKSGLRVTTTTGVGNLVNRALETAARHPFMTLAAETGLNASSATAEGIYEAVDPGHPGRRALVGVAAGVGNPLRIAAWGGQRLTHMVSNLINRNKEGSALVRSLAGQRLASYLKISGGDPEKLVAAINEGEKFAATIPGHSATAGQLTGDPILLQLEADLAEKNRAFGASAAKQAEDTMHAYANAVAMLRGTGDPEALQAAAVLERQRLTMLIETAQAQADKEAADAADQIVKKYAVVDAEGKPVMNPDGTVKMTADKASTRAELSVKVQQIYLGMLDKVRAVEERLWQNVASSHKDPASSTTIRRAYGQLLGEMAAGGQNEIPAAIRNRVQAISDARDLMARVESGESVMEDGSAITTAMINAAKKTLSVENVIKFRSDMLGLARDEIASKMNTRSTRASRWYGVMAEAALADLIGAGAATRVMQNGTRQGAGGRFVPDAASTAYDEAREFSRAVRETFNRSFAGQAQRVGPYGDAVPPETWLKTALGTADEAGMVKLRELADVTEFLPVRKYLDAAGLETVSRYADDMINAQDRVLRLAAQRAMRGGYKGLQKFIEDADPVLQKFPEVKRELEAAVATAETAERWTREAKDGLNYLEKRSPLAAILGSDSVTSVISGVVNSKTPHTGLINLLKQARDLGPEAVDSLRVGIWDFVIKNSRDPAGRVSLREIVHNLGQPIKGDPNLPSIRDFLVDNGLMTRADSELFDNLISEAAKVEQAISTRATAQSMDIVEKRPNLLTALLIRMTGSETGRILLHRFHSIVGAASGGMAGSSLMMAQRASQMAQDLIVNLPNAAVEKLLVQALSGAPLETGGRQYGLLKALLENPKGQADAMKQALMLHTYAWVNLGLGAQSLGQDSDTEPPKDSFDALFRSDGAPATDGDLSQFQAEGPLGTEQVGTTESGRPIIRNPDGSISTHRTVTVEIDGQTRVVPTIFGGKEVPVEEAVRIMEQNNWTDPETGDKYPAFGNEKQANEWDAQMHRRLEQDPNVQRAQEGIRGGNGADGLRGDAKSDRLGVLANAVPRRKPTVAERLANDPEFIDELKKAPLARLGFSTDAIKVIQGERGWTNGTNAIYGTYYPGGISQNMRTFMKYLGNKVSGSSKDTDTLVVAENDPEFRTTLMHELRHRGISILRRNGVTIDYGSDKLVEEDIVRLFDYLFSPDTRETTQAYFDRTGRDAKKLLQNGKIMAALMALQAAAVEFGGMQEDTPIHSPKPESMK